MNPTELLNSIDEVPYNPTAERIVSYLRNMNQNTESDHYFRVLTSFYLAQVASTMRTKVKGVKFKNIPTNCYAILLADSGFGKTKSVNTLERELLGGFRQTFLDTVLPTIVENSIHTQALVKSNKRGTDYDKEVQFFEAEYASYGSYVFDFPEGSGPAYRQIRGKCQFAEVGSTNMLIDEIGYNLNKITECLDLHFEAYDMGFIKDKILKASSEHTRATQRTSGVPANFIAYGTPDKVWDGGTSEKDFLDRLANGYSRRCLFALGNTVKEIKLTAEQIYDSLCAGSFDTEVEDLYDLFTSFADTKYYNKTISLDRDTEILLIHYGLMDLEKAKAMSSFDGTTKAEITHRHFKVIKLAGTYAFIDKSDKVTVQHILQAIRVVEESSKALQESMNRPKTHVRLAQYIATCGEPQTHSDLLEHLPFYPAAKQKQQEMFTLASSWGYKNHHILRSFLKDGIEFFSGETLKKTELSNLIVSYSDHEAYRYQNVSVDWETLQGLCITNGYHFVNHHLDNGHRADDNVLAEFNFIVFDCDGEIKVKEFSYLFEGTKCFLYTTKSHTTESHRFRVVVPLKYHLKLGKQEYKEFINNIYSDMPYQVQDFSGNQRSKKWLANKGSVGELEGELFDPVPYLPNTKKNQERLNFTGSLKDLGNIEKFFANQWHLGRNNVLMRYACMLADSGSSWEDLEIKVIEFNNSFSDALSIDELNNTIFKTNTIRKKYE